MATLGEDGSTVPLDVIRKAYSLLRNIIFKKIDVSLFLPIKKRTFLFG